MLALIGVVMNGTLVFALFTAGVAEAFTNGDMDAVSGAIFAPLVTLSTNRLSGQGLEGTFFLWADAFMIEAAGAAFISLQALLHDVGIINRDDCLFTRITAITTQDVVWSGAAVDTIFVAGFALTLIIVFGEGTFFDTKRTVPYMAASTAITGPRTKALALAFFVAVFADLIAGIIDPERCIAAIDARFTQSVGFAGQTLCRSGTPATVWSTFGMANKAFGAALFLVAVLLQQDVVLWCS